LRPGEEGNDENGYEDQDRQVATEILGLRFQRAPYEERPPTQLSWTESTNTLEDPSKCSNSTFRPPDFAGRDAPVRPIGALNLPYRRRCGKAIVYKKDIINLFCRDEELRQNNSSFVASQTSAAIGLRRGLENTKRGGRQPPPPPLS
jgi:hypothetical protein